MDSRNHVNSSDQPRYGRASIAADTCIRMMSLIANNGDEAVTSRKSQDGRRSQSLVPLGDGYNRPRSRSVVVVTSRRSSDVTQFAGVGDGGFRLLQVLPEEGVGRPEWQDQNG